MLLSQSGPCSTEFIYFVEYLPEINCFDRLASVSYMCTRVVSLRDIQYTVTSKVEQQFRHLVYQATSQTRFDVHTRTGKHLTPRIPSRV
jgi:hypothetical protein